MEMQELKWLEIVLLYIVILIKHNESALIFNGMKTKLKNSSQELEAPEGNF